MIKIVTKKKVNTGDVLSKERVLRQLVFKDLIKKMLPNGNIEMEYNLYYLEKDKEVTQPKKDTNGEVMTDNNGNVITEVVLKDVETFNSKGKLTINKGQYDTMCSHISRNMPANLSQSQKEEYLLERVFKNTLISNGYMYGKLKNLRDFE